MIKKLKNIFINNKLFLVLVFTLGVAILLLSIISFSLGHQYNSDEVHLQTMFNNDTILSGETKWFGLSSFVFKLPFIYIARIFANYSKFGIFLPTLMVNLVSVALYLWASVYFIKNLKLSKSRIVFPLWVLTLGGGFIFYLYNLNSRNVEIGLMFASLALVHKYISNNISERRFYLWGSIFSLIWGIIMVSDNYYMYMFIAPLIVISLINYLVSREKKYLKLVTLGIISLLFFYLFEYVYVKLNFIDYESSISFGSYNQITEKIYRLPEILINFTGNNFFGQKATKLSSIKSVISSLLLILGLAVSFVSLKFKDKKEGFVYIPAIMLFGIFVWIVSDRKFDYYLVLTPFFIGFILMQYQFKNSLINKIVIYIGVIAILLNTIFILNSLKNNLKIQPKPNSYNYEIIESIKNEGYKYGYATFWESTINTYLSKDEVKFVQAKCLDGKIFVERWYLSQTDLYDNKKDKNFFVFNSSEPQGCSKEIIESQLGEPSNIKNVGNYFIYLYDKNLAEYIK